MRRYLWLSAGCSAVALCAASFLWAGGFTLRDEFSTALSAGSINGTACEPNIGGSCTRTVIDTSNSMPISGGQLVVNYNDIGNPEILYSATRALGKLFSLSAAITSPMTMQAMYPLMLVSGNSSTPATTPYLGYFRLYQPDGVMYLREGTLTIPVGNYLTSGTGNYVIGNRTAGNFYFLKGGTTYPNFTLLYITSIDTTSTLWYGSSTHGNGGVYKIDYLRIPTTLWLPSPLASDGFATTFGTTDGAGHAESTGLGAGGAGLTWQSGGTTWSVSSAKAINTPTYAGTCTQANNRMSLVNGTAFYWCEGTDLSSYVGDFVRICSVTDPTQCAEGWAKAAGTGAAGGTLGSELYTTANAASDPNANEANATTGWAGIDTTLSSSAVDPHVGTYSIKIVATEGTNDRAEFSMTLIAGALYKSLVSSKRGAQGTTQAVRSWSNFGSSTYPAITVASTSWQDNTTYGVCINASGALRVYATGSGSVNDEVYCDNISVKQVTVPPATGFTIVNSSGGTTYNWLNNTFGTQTNDSAGFTVRIFPNQASMYATVETKTSDVIVTAAITRAAGQAAGVVVGQDSATSPANWVTGRATGTLDAAQTCALMKTVSGARTAVISDTTCAYSAGGEMRVIRDGTAFRLYYNNALVGSVQTISDVGTGTLHGIMSTDATNTIDNFTVYARGTGNEYAILDNLSTPNTVVGNKIMGHYQTPQLANATADAGVSTPYDFGNVVDDGSYASKTFTITNTGNVKTIFGQARLTEMSQYSITSDTCNGNTVLAGGTCTVGVRFTPTGTGVKTGSLLVPFEDTISSSRPYACSGSGSVALANFKFSGVDGSAFLDFTGDSTAIANLTNASNISGNCAVTITDGTHSWVGYIKSQGTGVLTDHLGTEQSVTNFTGWTAGGSGWTLASNALTGVSANAGPWEYSANPYLRWGLYTIQFTSTRTAGTQTFQAGFDNCLSNFPGHGTAGTFRDYAIMCYYATATGSSHNAVGSGYSGVISDLTINQVTAPSSNGVRITSTSGGTTYNWGTKDNALDPAATSYNYAITAP